MDKALDPGEAILQRIAELEVERAKVEAQVSVEMLALADFRHAAADAELFPARRGAMREQMVDELSAALQQPPRVVQCRLSAVRRVRDRMPVTWAAHLEGLIDGYRVSLIASAVAKLTMSESEEHLDLRAGNYGGRHTASQLKGWLNRMLARLEPEQANSRSRHEFARRAVWSKPQDDGMSRLTAYIKTTDAIRIEAMLTAAAKNKKDDGRTFDQRRADAFVSQFLGQPAQSSSARAVIGVIVPVDTLAGLSHVAGESVDGSFALPADMVRDLANQPGTLFYRIMKNRLGHILDITEIGYKPSSKLRHAVEIRDGTCQFATCDRPAFDCDLDHHVPWPHGPTNAENLQALCRRHHRMKTFLTEA